MLNIHFNKNRSKRQYTTECSYNGWLHEPTTHNSHWYNQQSINYHQHILQLLHEFNRKHDTSITRPVEYLQL